MSSGESHGIQTTGFIEDTSKNYMVNLLSFFFGFIYVFLIARLLGPEKFGQVLYVMTLVPGIALVFGLGAMQDIIVNFGSKHRDWRLLKWILFSGVLASFLLSLALFFFGRAFSSVLAAINYNMLLASIPILCLFVVYSFYYSLFQAFKNFGLLVKLVLLDNIANLALAVVMFFFLNLDVYAIIFAKVISLVLDIFFLWNASCSLQYSKTHSGWNQKEVLDYAWKALAIEFPKQLPGQVINWLLGAFSSTKLIGEYFFAQKTVAGAIDNVYTSIKETVYPYANENYKDPKMVKLIIVKSARMAFLVTSISLVVLSVFIFPFLQLFFPKYYDSALIAIILGATLVINTITISASFFRTFRYLGDTFRITIEYSLLVIAFSVALIPAFGVYGLVAGQLFVAICNHFLIYKRYLGKRGFVFSILPGKEEVERLWRALGIVLGNILALAKHGLKI